MQFLKDNIYWIKDLFTILFTFVGTVITILSYNRARYTILQPLRSEVVKKQTDFFIKLLTFFESKEFEYLSLGCYQELISVNCLISLDELGFKMKAHNEVMKTINEKIVGKLILPNSELLSDVELITTFKTKKDENKQNLSKENYDKLKQGEFKLAYLSITKDYSDILESISNHRNNVLMPKDIKNKIDSIIEIDKYNVQEALVNEVENFVIEFSTIYFSSGDTNFNLSGVWNKFNRQRKAQKNQVDDLKESIRKYLMIDLKW